MSLELWKPLKITNPLLEDIFHLNIDTKFKINPLINSWKIINFLFILV
ncbi:hypothetical protein VZ212_02150 [Metamycoplasma hominis]